MAEISTTFLGKSVRTLDSSPEFQPISQVILVVDENTKYTAGNTTGRSLTVECPWGTQAMANNILARLNGYIYTPYKADGALLNPAMELGDAVTVGDDTFGGIYKRNINFNSLLTSEISAPQDEEIDHEFPWASQEQRQTDRKFAVVNETIQANYSELSVQASQISASVTQVSNSVTALNTNKLNAKQTSNTMSWSLDANGFYVNNGKTANSSNYKFKVDSNGASVNGTIVATAGSIGGFTIKNGYLTTNTSRTSHSGTQSGILLNASGLSMGNGSKRTFYVSNTGALTATNATIEGNIKATSGTFGSLSVSNGQTNGTYYGGLNSGVTCSYGGTTYTAGSAFRTAYSAADVANYANSKADQNTVDISNLNVRVNNIQANMITANTLSAYGIYSGGIASNTITAYSSLWVGGRRVVIGSILDKNGVYRSCFVPA